MANAGLFGPYPLTAAGIKATFVNNGPGVYALGTTRSDGTFIISYVGRSDDDLAGRLGDHIGKHPQFKCGLYSTAALAYQKECRLYHDFQTEENTIHPARPSGSLAKCPVCGF